MVNIGFSKNIVIVGFSNIVIFFGRGEMLKIIFFYSELEILFTGRYSLNDTLVVMKLKDFKRALTA